MSDECWQRELCAEVNPLKSFIFINRKNIVIIIYLGFQEGTDACETVLSFLKSERARRKSCSVKISDLMLEVVTEIFLKELRGMKMNLKEVHRRLLAKENYETFRNQLSLLRTWKEAGFKSDWREIIKDKKTAAKRA